MPPSLHFLIGPPSTQTKLAGTRPTMESRPAARFCYPEHVQRTAPYPPFISQRIREKMIEGPLVFVDIDTQRDFLEPTGSLYVPGSAEILPNLQRLLAFARDRKVPVLATACCHLADDAELRIFPPHCMSGTVGQERVPATACPDSIILAVDERLTGEIPDHLTLQKRELDVFSRPDADHLLARYDRSRPTFVVYGVATDYCVRAAVEGLLERNCQVAIVTDAIRAIDVSAESTILSDFARRGSLLTVTDVVCRLSTQ
jgi:nicotinamidase/pyrazinamidase